MPKQVYQVELESSGKDLMGHLAAIVKASKAAMKAGGGLGAEIPAEVSALVLELPAIIADVPQIKPDLLEDHEEFQKGLMLGAFDVYDALKS